MKRLAFEIRWWRWFFSNPPWPVWMYQGPAKLDKESRKIILDRLDAEWFAREPLWEGKPRWTKPN